MTKVFVARHPTEAHLLKGVLEQRGIPSEIRGEALFGARGEIPLTEGLPELWVINDDQADEAIEVLGDVSTPSSDVADAQLWRCSNCGETVEPQFGTCWRCSTDKVNPS